MHVDVDGARLWFDVDGPALVPDGAGMRERPTVILVHGGPGSFDHSYFKPDFGRLADVAQVVYLDALGHGRSDHGDAAAWTYERAGDSIKGFCDVVGIDRPIVYGHSLGGMIVLAYAAAHPAHPRALVLQSTAGRFDVRRLVEDFRKRGGDEVADIAARSYGTEERDVSPEEWQRCWALFGPNVPSAEQLAQTVVNLELNQRAAPLLSSFDVIDQLGPVTCPALVCVGELDPVTPPAAARELADALPGARLEVLAGAGHWTWMDVPDAYWPLLTAFLTSV